jgi:hypothetical protein
MLDEFYIWEEFRSTRRFDRDLWKNFRVAVKFGRIRWRKKVLCTHCKEMVGWCGSTINLRKHLQNYHQDLLLAETELKKPFSNLPDERYQEILVENTISKPQPLITTITDVSWIRGSTDRKKGGKYPIWNLFSFNQYSHKYVRCELCQGEVYWNRRGVAKLKAHFFNHHLNNRNSLDISNINLPL